MNRVPKSDEGHLYIVDLAIFKVGLTTSMEKRMYWYDPGVELIYLRHTKTNLRLIEAWKRPEVYTCKRSRVLVTDAIHIINNILDLT